MGKNSKKIDGAEELYKCDGCGSVVKKGEKYCAMCGAKLDWSDNPDESSYCAKCGKKIVGNGDFCAYCGNKLRETPDAKEKAPANRTSRKRNSSEFKIVLSNWKPFLVVLARYGGLVMACVGFISLIAQMTLSDGETHRMYWYAALASYIPEGIAWVLLFGGLVLYVIGRSLDEYD